MAVANLRLNITSTWSGDVSDGARRVASTLGAATRGITRVARTVGRVALRLGQMVPTALLLAPAMFTLGKAALALAAGVVTLGVVVGAAALPWIALAVTAARNADQMGPAGARFEAGANGVKRAWMDLAQRTAHLTLGPVTDVLNGIAAAIPKLEPLVRDVAPTFAQMGRDIQSWLSGRGFERFLENIRDYGVPAFKNLASAGKDTLATLGIGFREFLPLARDIGETLERGAATMRRESGGGFQSFLENVKRDWPSVNRFLREAGESMNTIAGVLEGMGPGQLGAIETGLDLFNKIDTGTLMAIAAGIAAFLAGKDLAALLGALALFKSGALEIGSGVLLSAAAASLAGAAFKLLGLALKVALEAMRLTEKATEGPNTDALDNIRKIWGEIKKGASCTLSLPTVELVRVQMMGVNSTRAALESVAAMPATFQARVDSALLTGVAVMVVAAWTIVRAAAAAIPVFTAMAITTAPSAMALILLSWTAVRVMAAIPALFRAMAIPGTVPIVAFQIITAWARVRAEAAAQVTFTATASPGNVVAVSNQIVSLWNRVKALAASPANFVARATAGGVAAGMNAIINAWRSVTSMPRSWRATATVNSGAAVSGSAAIKAAWAAVYNMPRAWTAVATVVVRGGFSGIQAPPGASGGGLSVINIDINPGSQPVPFLVTVGQAIGSTLTQIPGITSTVSEGLFDFPPDTSDQDPLVNDPSIEINTDGDPGNAEGGPIGHQPAGRRYGHIPTGGRERHIHIYDDVWVKDASELAGLLADAIGG